MTLIPFREANPVPRPSSWVVNGFDVRAALTAGGGVFVVDDVTQPALVSALHSFPGVYKADGSAPVVAGPASVSSLIARATSVEDWIVTSTTYVDSPYHQVGAFTLPEDGHVEFFCAESRVYVASGNTPVPTIRFLTIDGLTELGRGGWWLAAPAFANIPFRDAVPLPAGRYPGIKMQSKINNAANSGQVAWMADPSTGDNAPSTLTVRIG